MKYEITKFDNLKHRDKVISLWEEVFGYEADHNAPDLVIDKKLDFGDGLFFIVTVNRDVLVPLWGDMMDTVVGYTRLQYHQNTEKKV